MSLGERFAALRSVPAGSVGPRLEALWREELGLDPMPLSIGLGGLLRGSWADSVRSRDKTLEALDPSVRRRFEAALELNREAEVTVEELGGERSLRGARVAELGARGSYLVAAGRRGAQELLGLEHDERGQRFAVTNLADHSLESDAVVLVGDPLDEQVLGRVGTGYDLIVLSDLVVRVADPRLLVRTVMELLTPQTGQAVFLLPNPRSSRQLQLAASSGRLGLSVLGPDSARRLHAALGGVGDLRASHPLDLELFLFWFSELGSSVRLIQGRRPANAVQLCRDAYQTLAAESRSWGPYGVDDSLVEEVHDALARLVADFDGDEQSLKPHDSADLDAFLRTYYDARWRLVVAAPAAS